jgi:hypothetical protein
VRSKSQRIPRIRLMHSRAVLGPAALEIDQPQRRQIFDGSLNSEHKSVATVFFSSVKWATTHSVQALCGEGHQPVRWRPRCKVRRRSSVQTQHCAANFLKTLDRNGRDDANGGLANDGQSCPGCLGAPRRSASRGKVVHCKHASRPRGSQHLRCALNAGGVYSSSVSLCPRCHGTDFSGRR